MERRRLLTCVLKLERERGSDYQVARTLRHLAEASDALDLHKEGIRLAKEALEIGEWLGDKVVQARCLAKLAFPLCRDNQFDAAEEAVSRAIDFFPEKGEEYRVCQSHRTLGHIYRSKRQTEKAIHHFGVALRIASPFNWHYELFWNNYGLAWLFCDEGRFDDANTHIEHAKSHTVNSVLNLGYAMEMQAWIWYRQRRLKEARSEALRAADVYEKLGAAKDAEDCGRLLRDIPKELNTMVASDR